MKKEPYLMAMIIVGGVVWLLAQAIPASFWYNAGEIEFADTAEGDEVTLTYLGGPRRRFLGSYSVTVQDAATGGNVEGGEYRSGVFTYDPLRTRRPVLTATWWAPGAPALIAPAAGQWISTTCWTIHGVPTRASDAATRAALVADGLDPTEQITSVPVWERVYWLIGIKPKTICSPPDMMTVRKEIK